MPGEEVGRLKAKDPDLGDNGLVNYRLIDGDGMAMFELSVDSETREAVIKLKKVRNDRLRLMNQYHQEQHNCWATLGASRNKQQNCRHDITVIKQLQMYTLVTVMELL